MLSHVKRTSSPEHELKREKGFVRVAGSMTLRPGQSSRVVKNILGMLPFRICS